MKDNNCDDKNERCDIEEDNSKDSNAPETGFIPELFMTQAQMLNIFYKR